MRCLNLVATFAITLVIGAVGACNRKADTQTDSTQGGKPAETFADSQAAATQSLAVFRQLVNNQNYKELGFESVDEVANATLGDPLPVVFVRLDQLREYHEGTDLNGLLSQTNQMNYPVMARDQVRSSVVVEQVNGRWKTSTLGNGALAKLIVTARSGRANAAGPTQQALVHVAALSLHFLAERRENKWTLTPLTASPELNLAAGSAIPAEEVFTRLAAAAKSLRDDAPS